MATKKFKKNMISLLNLFDNPQELIEFLSKKDAFSEEFVKQVTDTDYFKVLKNLDETDLNEIKRKLQYEIGYNQDKNQISVDITKNDVFSYLDNEDDLIKKMNNYIRNEDYEKAQIMKNYFKTIELDY